MPERVTAVSLSPLMQMADAVHKGRGLDHLLSELISRAARLPGVDTVRFLLVDETPVPAPRANAIAERFVATARRRVPRQMLIPDDLISKACSPVRRPLRPAPSAPVP